jgi:hypothetical protein
LPIHGLNRQAEIEELRHRFQIAESRGCRKVGAAQRPQRQLPLRPIEPAAQFRPRQRKAERGLAIHCRKLGARAK